MTKHTTITLEAPIHRPSGDTTETITTVALRCPKAGELRGLHTGQLAMGDYAATSKLLTRITTPRLTEAEIADLDGADFFTLNTAVMDFLLPASMKEQAFPT